VQTHSIKLVNETEFSISVNTNVPVTFDLPEWVEPVDVEPVVGEKAYKFRAQPLTATARRSDIIYVEGDIFDPAEVMVTQIFIGDELPEPIGAWTFDDATDILSGSGTATLSASVKAPAGSTTPVPVADPVEAGITAASGTTATDGAATIPVDTYLRIEHNQGGDLNTFSVLMDILPHSLDGFNALFQSHPDNDDDASLFTKGTQIGINLSGLGYGGTLVPGQWHRIVFVVSNNSIAVFIDGVRAVATDHTNTDRWILHDTAYFFADEDREEGVIDVADLRVWDIALPVAHVGRLAGPGSDTAIRPAETDDMPSTDARLYDLTGRRLSPGSLQKGLYILNGRKYLIRN